MFAAHARDHSCAPPSSRFFASRSGSAVLANGLINIVVLVRGCTFDEARNVVDGTTWRLLRSRTRWGSPAVPNVAIAVTSRSGIASLTAVHRSQLRVDQLPG
jgi:hypothetical protein